MPLHPDSVLFLEAAATTERPGWNELPLAEARQLYAEFDQLGGSGRQLVCSRNQSISEHVSVRIYQATEEPSSPAIVYFHGGGWVLGDLNSHNRLCEELAVHCGFNVIAVDYRRSPEATFPTPLNDCYQALQWVSNSSQQLNINANQMIVAGDSAGGNLAAAVCLKAQQESGPAICGQVLIYPALDHRCCTESYTQFRDGFGLTSGLMKWFWQQYLNRPGDGAHPLASPISADSLLLLPPAFVITAEYDVLRDEGDRYAEKLQLANVPTKHICYSGMIHGFVHFASAFESGRQALQDIAEWTKALSPTND